DYTLFFKYDKDAISLWGAEFDLTKPPSYPIKTYFDYGLQANPKEELKVDPLISTLEFLGSISRGEQIWIQILIQAHKTKRKPGSFFYLTKIQDEAEQTINDLLNREAK